MKLNTDVLRPIARKAKTAHEAFKAFLTAAGLEVRDVSGVKKPTREDIVPDGNFVTVVYESDTASYCLSGAGYSGFFSEFKFDLNGDLVEYGSWE